ncbi:MAG: hypothetical protein MUQ30_09505, partial [Anaerolineae bacterium]|nr:hypothetical protein [Anaerolineae bacterium]
RQLHFHTAYAQVDQQGENDQGTERAADDEDQNDSVSGSHERAEGVYDGPTFDPSGLKALFCEGARNLAASLRVQMRPWS